MERMNHFAQGTEAAAGDDPARQLLDAVRTSGPTALAELLGDQGFLLVELATQPSGLFSPASGSSSQYSDVLRRLHEQRAAMDALEMRCIVALADAFREEDRATADADAAQEPDAVEALEETERRAERAAIRDVSMRTRRSPALAGRTLSSARRLVESMPVMLRAVAKGQLSEGAARSTAASVAALTPARREQVDALLGDRLAPLDGCGTEQWRGEVAAAIAESDPEGEARRHAHARQGRSVSVRRGEHGMAVVSARLPAMDAMKIRKRLSLEAERLRASGDRRGHQQIQADSFVASLLGLEDGIDRTDLDLGVIITDRALLNPGCGDLAQIEGYGPITAEAVRAEVEDGLRALTHGAEESLGTDTAAAKLALRRLYTHPTTGELVAVESIGRVFPKALARFIRWRDMTCRGPFCNAPIRHADHIKPHAAGGHTCLDNGQGLCAFCNDKEEQTAAVEREPDSSGHRVTWTSRTGATRGTGPVALTSPLVEAATVDRTAGPAAEPATSPTTPPAAERAPDHAADQGHDQADDGDPPHVADPPGQHDLPHGDDPHGVDEQLPRDST
ncbi:hypothetical protein CIK66_09260 [Brachybacterium alimentarium]|uniref:HNH nuclease domain-containing protein n=2 Tax=Brachybacterium alimentarium TaxID=47845 RepID=A0A2A3YJF7_9MICO|nr:hypothetical protein CIK66_09260 [Brachybacterium alimentarium]